MSDGRLILSFPGVPTREGNLYASSLSDALKDVDAELQIELLKERPETQDFGATLGIILGSKAVVVIAAGLAKWLARNSGARLTISSDNGQSIASNLDSGDAARIAEALSGRR